MAEKHDFYKTTVPFVRFALDKRFERHVEGIENIPDQPALFAANHVQFLDSIFVALAYTEATGKPLRFVAKKEYFDGKGIDDHGKYGRSLKWAMEHTLQIPVDRESTDRQAPMILQNAIKDRIDRGDSVALHPEGTRSDDGRLHKFKSSAARIAIALSIPIVPTGLVYSQPGDGSKPRAEVLFGKPIMPEAYHHLPYAILGNGPKANHLTQVVENRVAELTGMEQSHSFAILKKFRHPRDGSR